MLKIDGGMLSFTSKLKSKGFTGFSVLVSRISKCRCGPDELPEFPESATTSPLAKGNYELSR